MQPGDIATPTQGGVSTFRSGSDAKSTIRGGWVKKQNFEKYFGTFRSQFLEKLTKIVKKGRFFSDFHQNLEKKLNILSIIFNIAGHF